MKKTIRDFDLNKDNSFKTDKDKINLEERIKKISPETEISIL